MGKHSTQGYLDIQDIIFEGSCCIVSWCEFPFYSQRTTVYQLEDVIFWAMESNDEGKGVALVFLMDEFEDMVKGMIAEFHEYHTRSFWQLEYFSIQRTIDILKHTISRYEKIIDALMNKIKKFKTNRVLNSNKS